MPRSHFDYRVFRTIFAALSVCVLGAQAQALTFDFTSDDPLLSVDHPEVYAAFTEAGQLWSSVITDNVTVNIKIGYEALDPGVIGQASSEQYFFSYADYRAALVSDGTSSYDTAAVASLPNAAFYDVSYNYVDDGEHTPSATTIAGSSNRIIISQATLRAIGNPTNEVFTQPDASITFSSSFAFDFDRSNGIDSNKYDFVGVALHEIGHALGFTSIVDAIDANALGTPLNGADIDPTAFDLFRYSLAGSVRDISAGKDAYFSYNSGATVVGDLSTGKITGDGQQASHWVDLIPPVGSMDPTLGLGETEFITTADLIAFDVIGWDVAQFAAVPEPATTALLVAGGALGLSFWRRRSRRA